MNTTEDNNWPETADIETASDDYASRFSGETGKWMLELQKEITLALLADTPGISIADIGGGHAQLAAPLSENGYKVTVTGSSKECEKRISGSKCDFKLANNIALPFSDKSFDTAISFRLITHCKEWQTVIAELCRISENSVIIDYPTSQSINKFSSAFFSAKKSIEKNTRTWHLLKHDEIRKEFEKHGFLLSQKKGQFFLPMVLHRSFKNRKLSSFLEAVCNALIFPRYFSSPVIAKFTRKK